MLFNTVLFTGNANPALAQEIATHLGVELGKALANRILPELEGGPAQAHDPSTMAWIERLKSSIA